MHCLQCSKQRKGILEMTDEAEVRFQGMRGAAAVLDTPQGHLPAREHSRHEVTAMNLLIVDDEQFVREMCGEVGQGLGMKVTSVATAEEATELLEYSPIDILLTDLQLPGASGLALLKNVRDTYPEMALMVLTQYGTIDSAVEVTELFPAPFRPQITVNAGPHGISIGPLTPR